MPRPRLFNNHDFVYPAGVDSSEPRLGYRDIDAEGGVEALLHPAVKSGAYLSPDEEQAALAGIEAAERAAGGGAPSDYREFADADDIAASRAGGSGNPMHGMAYDHGTGEGASPITDAAQRYLDARSSEKARRQQLVNDNPSYMRHGRGAMQGYLNNPFDEAGRKAISTQFWEAPLSGRVRQGLEGQELFGHRITGDQARMAEQGLAGLTAVGIGVPTFLAAVNQLTTPQSAETIPM